MKRLLAGAICATLVPVAAPTAAAPSDKGFERGHRPILFNIAAGQVQQVATVHPAGHDVRKLTDFNAGTGEAQWAPSGGRIVVERYRKGETGLLYTMRPGGEQLRRITSGCNGTCLEDFEPAWSNGGGLLAFNRAFGPVDDETGAAAEIDLMVVGRNGNNPRVLARFPFRGGKRSLEPHNPDFSPDDSQLAVTLLNTLTSESAIFTYTFATDEFDRVTPWRLDAGNADWSAGGNRILFNSNYAAGGASAVYTIAPDGSGLRRLTHFTGERSAFAPTWSPSNRRVAFSVASPRVAPHPVVMNVGGENRHRVTRQTGIVLDWG